MNYSRELFKRHVVPQINFPRIPDPVTPELVTRKDGTRVLSKKAQLAIKRRLENQSY